MKYRSGRMVESAGLHFVLFQFIAAEDDDLLRLIFIQQIFVNFLPKEPVPPVMSTT